MIPRGGTFYQLHRAGFRWFRAMPAAIIWLVISLAEIRPAVSQGQIIQSQANTNSNEIKLDSKYGVGAWIWAEETHDQQLCRFWRVFEIPARAQVVDARLRIAVDDS